MVTHDLLEEIDTALRYISSEFKDCRFGRKNILFAGDFLQLPPVVPNSSTTDVFTKCLLSSGYFNDIKTFSQSRPMRSRNNNFKYYSRR